MHACKLPIFGTFQLSHTKVYNLISCWEEKAGEASPVDRTFMSLYSNTGGVSSLLAKR